MATCTLSHLLEFALQLHAFGLGSFQKIISYEHLGAGQGSGRVTFLCTGVLPLAHRYGREEARVSYSISVFFLVRYITSIRFVSRFTCTGSVGYGQFLANQFFGREDDELSLEEEDLVPVWVDVPDVACSEQEAVIAISLLGQLVLVPDTDKSTALSHVFQHALSNLAAVSGRGA